MAADLGWNHFLWAGTLIILSNEVQIFQKISNSLWFYTRFLVFLSGLLCFSSKSLYPESVTAAMFTVAKN